MRLTMKQSKELKNGKIVDYYGYKPEQDYQIIQKLGKYEDIDEKLGLPYPIFFKAFFNGVNYLDDSGQIIRTMVNIYDLYLTERKEIAFITNFGDKILLFKDYGKTWALTREELEYE